MGAVIACGVLAGAFVVALGLRAWGKFNWFTAWFVGAMVMPAALWISEIFQPTGLWPVVELIFGGIPAAGLAALGAIVGSAIIRKRKSHVAS